MDPATVDGGAWQLLHAGADELFGTIDDVVVTDAEVESLQVTPVTSTTPLGAQVEFTPVDDPITTNICFGGPDLTTAYVTLSGTGQLGMGE